MSQFWSRLTAAFKTIGKMVFIDCRVDIIFILAAVVFAFLATYLAGMIMSAASFAQGERTDIAYLVPIFTLSALFGIAAIRSGETFRPKPISRSFLVAALLGLGLLASRSAWNGFNPTTFDLTVPGILLLMTVCLFAPICEELFFRGYLWTKLSKQGYDCALIVIATSLLYVLPHVPSSLAAFADYATIGLFLGFIRYFGGGLVLPMLFHVAMNSMLIFRL